MNPDAWTIINAGQQRERPRRSSSTELCHGNADGRKCWMKIIEARNIVEADQRHLARHRHATPAQFRKRAKRHRIVGNEHCGEAGLCQQLSHRPRTTLTREFTNRHPRRQTLVR